MARSSRQIELDRLVTQCLPAALRFATRLTGDVDAAEDVLQEALVRAARSWKTFRGDAEFSTWLFRIVINVFRDRIVKSARDQGAPFRDVVDSRTADPAAQAQHAEFGQLVAARVSALSPRQREVVVLTAFEGLSTRETAALLGITEANVHATLGAARERLRNALAPYFAER